MVLRLVLLLPCAVQGLLSRTTPIVRAYRASATCLNAGLTTRQVRHALADVGMDVGEARAQRIVKQYGANDRMRLRHFHRFVTYSREADGARIWITLDPHGDARRSRVGFSRFCAAGLLTPTRMAHYGVGIASIAVGTFDFADYITSNFAPDIDSRTAVAHGALHTAHCA